MGEGSLLCPVCGIRLRRRIPPSTPGAYCPHCGGMWLTSVQWKVMMDEPDLLRALDLLAHDTAGLPAVPDEPDCPRCGDRLKTVSPEEATSLLIEKCPSCDGIWLKDGQGLLIASAVAKSRQESLPPLEEEPPSPAVLVECPYCLRPNFSDADECWACGKTLADAPQQRRTPFLLEKLMMGVSLLGVALVLLSLNRPTSAKITVVGLFLLLGGLAGLSLVRSLWEKPPGSGLFPTLSR